jgi:hypothetical protein
LDGFISAHENDVTSLAALSQTPAHEMLGKMANLSAEALAAAEASLTRKVVERRHTLGEAHEQALRLSAHIMGETEAARDYAAEVRWADIACQPMVLQRALAAKFQLVARSRHPICLNGPLMGEPTQRLGAVAQTGFAGVGCKPFQCFAASTGYALSGCLVCGAAQGGTASGCRRRRTITIAPPQAQRQTGRCGEVDVGGGAADGQG